MTPDLKTEKVILSRGPGREDRRESPDQRFRAAQRQSSEIASINDPKQIQRVDAVDIKSREDHFQPTRVRTFAKGVRHNYQTQTNN